MSSDDTYVPVSRTVGGSGQVRAGTAVEGRPRRGFNRHPGSALRKSLPASPVLHEPSLMDRAAGGGGINEVITATYGRRVGRRHFSDTAHPSSHGGSYQIARSQGLPGHRSRLLWEA